LGLLHCDVIFLGANKYERCSHPTITRRQLSGTAHSTSCDLP
jgi:hypothetical protein